MLVHVKELKGKVPSGGIYFGECEVAGRRGFPNALNGWPQLVQDCIRHSVGNRLRNGPILWEQVGSLLLYGGNQTTTSSAPYCGIHGGGGTCPPCGPTSKER